MSGEALAVRPWKTPSARRLGLAGLFLFAVALTGCGTATRIRTGNAPTVTVASAMPERMTPPAGTIFRPVKVDAAPATVVVEPVVTEPEPVTMTEAVALTEPVPPPPSVPIAVVAAETEVLAVEADAQDRSSDAPVLAQARGRPARGEKDDYDLEEYDPWEGFNEVMFDFNRKLDQYVLKPVAKVWDKIVPDEVQRMLANGFDNLESVKRFVNSLLQGKFQGAAREMSRFMLNTTVGVGGLFDVAKAAQIEKSREDFGQTLGFYGVGPGPYLVLPVSPPSTVRDTIGSVADGFLNPLRYIVPSGSFFFDFFAGPGDYFSDSWVRLVIDGGEIVNDRSLNLELYQGFEETVIDMYSAVRHAYLERRRNLIKE